MKTTEDLKNFIEQKTESINTIGITDNIDEEYLSDICEEYFNIKSKINYKITYKKRSLTINSFDGKKSLTVNNPTDAEFLQAFICDLQIRLLFEKKESKENYTICYTW